MYIYRCLYIYLYIHIYNIHIYIYIIYIYIYLYLSIYPFPLGMERNISSLLIRKVLIVQYDSRLYSIYLCCKLKIL